MPNNRKEAFDIAALLDAPDPITPLSIQQRVQHTAERPFYNTQYLASFVANATPAIEPANRFTAYTCTCPNCDGQAELATGFTGDKPFKLTCSGSCASDTLRARLHDLAPAAFEHRDDIIYPFPIELADSVISAAVDGKALLLDLEQRSKLRGFRNVTSEVSVAAYHGPYGKPIMFVFRGPTAGGKTFLPAHIAVDVSDGVTVVFGYPDGLWPIYGWGDLVARPDAPVLAVEGEKTAAHAAHIFPEYVVVTSAAGSDNAGRSDWSPLHNRNVIVWRDNDDKGSKYERAVAAHALAVGAASVSVVNLPTGLPDKWDLADPLPPGLALDDLRHCLAEAAPARWDEVKDALHRPTTFKAYPPFRLPDGVFAGNKQVVEAIEHALEQLNPGCNRRRWMGMLGAVHHALGEPGFALADTWSRRDAERHKKYQAGEVRRIFDAFAVAPSPTPLPLLALFRAAMKEVGSEAGAEETSWSPSAAALTLAYIADFEASHRKVTQGDNVMIAIQHRRSNGTYEVSYMQEKNAASVYLSRKTPDFQGNRTNLFTLWQNNQLIPPLKLVFKPDGDVAPDELNTFHGLNIKPGQGGSYSLFREHVETIMAANGDSEGYLWKLIAYRMQNLGTFVPALLVMIGREGSGKSTFTNVVAKLLAPYSIAFSDPEKFVGRNNADLQGKLFVQLEEMILGRKEDYDSRLKHYVTSAKLDVEQKFKAQWQIDNHLFVAMTANKRAAVRVTEHSRRFAVYEVEDRFDGDQAQREQFYGRMWAELEVGGYETLAFDLMHTDLEGFSPAAVPKTKLFLELAGVDADRDPLRAWWRETLERGVLCEAERKDLEWTAPIGKDALYGRYRGWCENDGTGSRAAILSKAEWAKTLGRMLPGGLPSKRMMVAGDRGHYLVLPDYETCCAHFERLFATTIDRADQPRQLKAVM